MNLRARAAKAVCRVADAGLTLDAALVQSLHGVERAADRGFIKELCFGTLRWFDQLEFLLARYLDRPLKQRDGDIGMLILVGLYQLHHLGTPPHAAISETGGGNRGTGQGLGKAAGQRGAEALTARISTEQTRTGTATPARIIPTLPGCLTGSGPTGRNNGKPYWKPITSVLPSTCGSTSCVAPGTATLKSWSGPASGRNHWI